MSLFRTKGIVKEDLSGHLHLLQPDLTHDDLARVVGGIMKNATCKTR